MLRLRSLFRLQNGRRCCVVRLLYMVVFHSLHSDSQSREYSICNCCSQTLREKLSRQRRSHWIDISRQRFIILTCKSRSFACCTIDDYDADASAIIYNIRKYRTTRSANEPQRSSVDCAHVRSVPLLHRENLLQKCQSILYCVLWG